MNKVWQVGEVVKLDQGRAWVRLSPTASCQRCLSGRGCGAGVFSRLFASGPVELPLENRIHARAGQRVMVGVSAGALARVAARVYGAPILAFVAGAWLAARLLPAHVAGTWPADAVMLVTGMALAIGLFVYLARRPPGGLEPDMRALVCGTAATTDSA